MEIMIPKTRSWLTRILGGDPERSRKRSRRPIRTQSSLWLEKLEDRMMMALPSVVMPTVTGITPYQAVLGGTVTSDGGSPLNFRGIVYSLTSVNPNPTRGAAGVAEVDASGVPTPGVFTLTVSPLTPNSKYSYRAFASNAEGTSYSPVIDVDAATFTTLEPNLAFPKDSFTPDPNDPNKLLNTILYFGPTNNDPNPRHFEIPTKTVTFTNNADFTVFPILVNTNATKDDLQPDQALYDPLDPIFNEYRGYIGHKDANGSYVGLLPGMAITVAVPLVFWDGARVFIGYDSTYLDMNNNAPQVAKLSPIPNPFQYYGRNSDGSKTLNVTLPAAGVTGAPAGTSGVVMWYRQGLDIKDPQQPIGPASDAPAQLAEFTIRDPILSKINPNIDKLKPNFGETHALINYDVSYVDNMALPIAMAALDVPIPVTDPPLPVQTPFPGPRLPFGWVGSPQTVDEFQAAIQEFLTAGPENGLGTYFGLANGAISPNYSGWTQYNFDVTNGVSPAFSSTPLIKIPSGQDAIANSPLGDVSSSFNVLANSFMLTSGGTDAKQVLGAGAGFSNGTKSLFIVANTPDLQNILKTQLQKGMLVTLPSGGPNAPVVPAGTMVDSIGPAGNPGFNFTEFTPAGGGTTTVLEIVLNNVVASSGKDVFSYTLARPATDYVTDTLVDLWYTWANYYVTNLPATAQNQNGLAGQALPDATTPTAVNNVIRLNAPNTHLVPGMVVTGSATAGISTNAADGHTTIVAIDSDNQTIHVSQGVKVGATGTYSFTLPTLSQVGGFDDPIVELLQPFTPVATPSVPDVMQFAQNAFQLLSFMSQVPPTPGDAAPRSGQVMLNVIGGNVTMPTNRDALHKIEVSFRTMVKSLLRGVNDFTKQLDQNLWYPDPATPVPGTGQPFNIFNLDPFVWFVHQKLGLSGYGFSLDDDAADIGANYATQLGISIGGLNGLPNQFHWSETAPFGPVSGIAEVLSLGPDTLKPPSITFPYEISGLPENVWYSVKALDLMNSVPGADVIGEGVAPGTFLESGADAAQTKFSFSLGNDKNPSPLTSAIGSSTQYTFFFKGTPNASPLQLQGNIEKTAISPFMNSSTVRIPVGNTLKITTDVGTVTDFTQQLQQFTREHGYPRTIPFTVVRGTLDASRVTIADGQLAGVGTVTGSLDLMGPLAGSSEVNSLGKLITIDGTAGGILKPGGLDGTPGILTIGTAAAPKDVRMYGATFEVNVAGAGTAGTDYSQISSFGSVDLGNSKLVLAMDGYVPKVGDSLTIVSAAKGIKGTFSQGAFISVDGHTFKITYNATTVVLSLTTSLGGMAFQDHDADGIRDGIDQVLANRTVFLDQDNDGQLGALEAKTITNAGGHYAFDDLPAGLYRVRMAVPAGGAATHSLDVNLAEGETLVGQDVGVRVNEATRSLPLTPLLYSVPRTETTLNAGLIDNLYQAILGRPGQEPGRSAVLARLTSGTPLKDIVQSFLQSREYRTRQVQSFYVTFLGREGQAAEVNAWVGVLERGVPVSSVIAGFMTSPEFTSAGRADAASFVRAAYELLLGRDQGPGEGAGWQARLEADAMTRGEVVRAFLNSPEARRRLLAAVYSSWLHRPLDSESGAFWSARLAEGMTFESLAGFVFSSPEVRGRTLSGMG